MYARIEICGLIFVHKDKKYVTYGWGKAHYSYLGYVFSLCVIHNARRLCEAFQLGCFIEKLISSLDR